MNPPLVWPYCAEYVVEMTFISWIGLDRRRALVALLVTARVPERRAVEEVLGRHRLPAVDAGVELAAAEHRVAVGPHRQVARLHQQHRFGEADVGAGHERQVLVVLLVHRVGHIRRRHVDAGGAGDLDGLRERTDRHRDVVANLLAASQPDAAALGDAEALELHLHRVGAQDEGRARVRASVVGDERRYPRRLLRCGW